MASGGAEASASPDPPVTRQASPTLRFQLVGSRAPRPSPPRPAANPHGELTIACEACHTAEGWDRLREPLRFDHAADAGFPLLGRHAQAACRSCHVDLRFDGPDVTPDACASCHLDVHQGQLGADCQQCHTTQDFHLVRGLEIHAGTAFPLTGSHLQVACEACHADDLDGAFRPLDPSCFACHQADYEGTADGLVNHVAVGFPTACDACHNTLTFGTGVAFDHAAASGGFGLLGAHAAAACTACHAAGSLDPLFQPAGPNDCFACHQADYEGTAGSLVNHPAADLPTDCQQCHTLDTWEGAAFEHASATGFPLVGAHVQMACETCHSAPGFGVPGNPAGPDDCFACHADDHAEAHPGFPTTCTDCHTTSAFLPATFEHAAVSGGFALVGAHVALPCSACHVGPDLEPIWEPAGQDDCLTCHTEDHAEAHPAFPTTCLDCHTTQSFEGGAFDHGATTGFALVGAHIALDCGACHTLPDFGLIDTPSGQNDCFACHADDHQEAHPGFPTTCRDCHTTQSFDGATFDHQQATGFPLVGVHVSLACSACHTLPDFEPLFDPAGPNDCYTCHADDHQEAHPGFPTTCLDCHQPDTWAGATFDHDPLFPIYSGRHEGEWASCQTCHVQPGNFSVFSCLTCHEHNREEMDRRHEDVGGYVYESTACYSCHPDGEE
ncbi:MAG: cytochrome c3 family protein [Rubricoccaceae bacterium]|nr:cytochrome c3 family protein [Rubricoccaceae bacterium]